MLLVVLFCASDSGIGLESGVYVTAIVQGSPAAREGSLTVGDRLIAVSACWKSFLKFFFFFIYCFPPHLPHHSSHRCLWLSNPGLSIHTPNPQIRWDLFEYVKSK